MRYLYRLRWDAVSTPWQPVPKKTIKVLANKGESIELLVDPSVLVGASVTANQSTRISIELKGVNMARENKTVQAAYQEGYESGMHDARLLR